MDKVPASILVIILAVILVAVGFALFPHLNTEVLGVSTTIEGGIGWNTDILEGVHDFIPFAFGLAILYVIFLAWSRRGSG